ncbi:class I adenylate-forming enzyme family protein [Bosea sp. BK604]|uniref:class I adenylate-forming enzyme family protein n=1 Tax=Bosea sp. BK604 TaxID=2512180 RepID=UPI0010F1AC65|nr:class I adenylate-forming enzyme family protein [Bosea sp. BK604]TCR63151.1 crotonobetaine/carnitine-CoA ligase [Bosea sp. BK604]
MESRDFDWLAAARERYRRIGEETLPPNVMALLESAAAAHPAAPALHFIETGRELTYAELLRSVHRLAAGLSEAGVEHGSHVGVMLPNVPEMPITWLALAAIGAVMVPINTRYTAHELHYVLTDSEASHLVIHTDFTGHLEMMPAAIAGLTTIAVGASALPGLLSWQALADRPAEPFSPARAPGLDDLLNIQYTSGTTGWPKGCMLSQRYWLTCAKAYADSDGLHYRRIMSSNPFFYMTPQWLMLMAFFHGATLHVAPYLSLTRFTEWLRHYQIEFCWFPSDIVAQVPPQPEDGELSLIRGNLAVHRRDLHAELERRFRFPARAAFGMTEIGTGLMMPIEAAEMVGSGSCGIAGPFREVRIADPAGNTVPPGSSGELLIRGPGMLQGYYKRPDATAAAFHGDWFRSGDLAVQDEHGFVTIQGRIKEMIRRAGENISATEVEAALLAIPGIAETAALPVPDALRGEEVKAYIVLGEGRSVEDLPPEQIIAQCSRRLASFKVPRFIEYRSAPLPRSTSGKVRKPDLVAEKTDLRAGSWDRMTGGWL